MTMAKPVIWTVDDDPDVLRAVERDLRRQYGNRYRVMAADSGAGALDAVKQLKLRNDPIALFLVDQRMPRMSGVEFLEAALEFYPEAKRAPGIRPKNVFTESWTTCSTTGRHRFVHPLKESGSSATGGRRISLRSGIFSRAIPSPIRCWTWRQMRQPLS